MTYADSHNPAKKKTLKHPDIAARFLRVGAYLAVALSAFTSSLTHGDDRADFFSLKTSIGQFAMNDNETRNIGTGQLIGGILDGALRDGDTDDYTAGIGASYGRRFGFWSAELELVWRYRSDWDMAAATPSIQTVTNIFSNVATTTLLANLARRGVINRNWSWEVGAGIGIVHHDIESEYLERAVPGVTPEQAFDSDNTETDFTYSLFGGVTRELPRDWTMNLRLRYLDLGELETGRFAQRAGRAEVDVDTIELQFAIERDF